MYEISHLRSLLSFGPGVDYTGPHFRLASSNDRIENSYDVLLFTDSKGSASDDPSTRCWTELIILEMERKGLTYLFVSRPKEMTVFFSLLSFLNKNRISFEYLITNLGFVDFTPKKIELMRDISLQIPSSKYATKKQYLALCKYRLSSGEEETLYSFDYGDIENTIAQDLSERFKYSLLIGSLEFSDKIQIQRQRPSVFFSQLRRTNQFLFTVAQYSERIHYVQPLKYQLPSLALLSFDAVHLTSSGHQAMYTLLIQFLEFYFEHCGGRANGGKERSQRWL